MSFEVRNAPSPAVRQGDVLREWCDFFLADGHILQEFPELLWQQAANQPQRSTVGRRAGDLLTDGRGPDRPWLRWINRPRSSAQTLTILGHAEEITRLAISGEGTRLISVSSDGLARVWEYPSGRALFELGGYDGGVTVAGTAGSIILTGGEDGTVRFWSMETGNLLAGWRAPGAPIENLVLSPDGMRLAVSYPGYVRIWDLKKRKEIACLEGGASLVFSPDGRYLAHGNDVYDMELSRDVFPGGGRVAFSPDGRLMANGTEVTIRLTDVKTGLVLCLLMGHTHWIGALAFSPDSKRLVSTGKHGEIMVWDVDPEAFSESTEYIPWVENAGMAEMRGYEVKVGRPLREIEGHAATISALVMLPDGRRFLTVSASSRLGPMMVGADIGIKVWSLDSGTLLGSVKGHGDRITAFALTPGCRRVITGDGRGVIKEWDIDRLDTEDDADTSSGHVTSIEVSPDLGTVIADTTRGKFIFDAATGRIIERSEWSQRFGEDIRKLDLGDGRWTVVYVKERRRLEVRDALTENVLAQFVFAEDIERLAARGPLIAAGGTGTANVYILEFLPAGSDIPGRG